MRINPPEFFGSKVDDDLQYFINKTKKVTQTRHVTEEESMELASINSKMLLMIGICGEWKVEVRMPL